MTDLATREELERWVPRQVRRLNGSLYVMAIMCGSWSECYRLVSKIQHRLELPLVKPWQLVKGKNQMNFLSVTSQSSLGHSHPGTLRRRRRRRTGAVKKLTGGKFPLPKLYDSPCGPKERVPTSVVCTVCGQHELTAWHDTNRPQDFHHRFKRDVQRRGFLKQCREEGHPITVDNKEDLKSLREEGKI